METFAPFSSPFDHAEATSIWFENGGFQLWGSWVVKVQPTKACGTELRV